MCIFRIHNIIATLACTIAFYGMSAEDVAHSNTREKIERYCQENKPYQDIIINGEIVYRGWNSRYCEERYDILCDIIKKIYAQAFENSERMHQCPVLPEAKVLELGAAQGYFPFRLAHDFGFTCLMVESGQAAAQYGSDADAISFLTHLCRQNSKINTAFFQATVTHALIDELGRTSHPDIILALCLLHALEDWRECIDALAVSDAFVIIELPDPHNGNLSGVARADKLDDMHRYIIQKGGVAVAHTPRFYKNQTSTFYLINGKQSRPAQNYASRWERIGLSIDPATRLKETA